MRCLDHPSPEIYVRTLRPSSWILLQLLFLADVCVLGDLGGLQPSAERPLSRPMMPYTATAKFMALWTTYQAKAGGAPDPASFLLVSCEDQVVEGLQVRGSGAATTHALGGRRTSHHAQRLCYGDRSVQRCCSQLGAVRTICICMTCWQHVVWLSLSVTSQITATHYYCNTHGSNIPLRLAYYMGHAWIVDRAHYAHHIGCCMLRVVLP